MTVRLLVCVAIVVASIAGTAVVRAQSPASAKGGAKGKAKPGSPQELKRLDSRLDEVREAFLRDTTTLITSYENLGQYERARMLLESLQKLDPRNEPIKAKLGELIAPPGSAGQPGTQGDRPPRPFAVGDAYEKPADRDGVLFLRVNVPPGAKCTGRLTALVSGPERPAQ
jgi:hypothetical protein